MIDVNLLRRVRTLLFDLDMGKYIDADRLKELLDAKYKEFTEKEKKDYCHLQYQYMADGLDVAEQFIDSLQQEQLDIDKIKRDWYNKGYLEGRKNAHVPARELGLPKSCDFQKEQSEVDLEKEIDRMWNPRFNLGWDDNSLLSINHKSFEVIARHFYNLGLNARKEY